MAFGAGGLVEQRAEAGGRGEDGLKHDLTLREQQPLFPGRQRQGKADAISCGEHWLVRRGGGGRLFACRDGDDQRRE